MSEHEKEPNKPDFATPNGVSQTPFNGVSQTPLGSRKDSQSQFAVPYQEGILGVPLFILDSLFPLLNLYEQAVYLRLYRLSHGNGNCICRISLADLIQPLRISKSAALRAIDRLEQLGLVERLNAEVRKGRQCNEYRVHLPATFVSEAKIVREEGERERESLSLSSPSRTRKSPAQKRQRQTRSRHTKAEREAFAEWQKTQGVRVRSVPALADHYASGKMDEEIARWQAEQARRARIAEHDNNPCPECDGVLWIEVAPGKGVIPCPRRAAARQATAAAAGAGAA